MPVPKKQILLNAFTMNCVGHINHSLWTHPRDRSSEYNTLGYWTDQAKLLERGLFDGVFLADIIGVYDVYGGGVDVTAREAVQLPVNDPMMLVSAMAAVTEHLGFGITVNVHNEAPYTFARRISTLDHLTGGRMGWNIVTGYLDSAHRGRGDKALPAHDRRYEYAEEYLEVLYKLWEGSWEAGAARRDRAARVFADPSRIRRIAHHGEFLDVEGYHPANPRRSAPRSSTRPAPRGAAAPSPASTRNACSSRPATRRPPAPRSGRSAPRRSGRGAGPRM